MKDKKSRDYFKSIISTIPDLIILFDEEGNYLDIWTSKTEDLVAPKNELIDKNVDEFLPEEVANNFKKYCSLAIENDELQTYEYSLDFKEGKKYFEKYLVPVDVEDENNNEVLAVIRNITEKKTTKLKLKRALNRLEMAIEGADLGWWEWNIKANTVETSEKCSEVLGYETTNFFTNWKERIHEDDKERVLKMVSEHLNGNISCKEIEYRIKTEEGNYKWIQTMGKVFKRDENGDPVKAVGIHKDIDRRKKAETRIKYLSFHDEMSGLYNRRYFENEIKRLNNSRKLPISIIIGDMDGLKYINDNYGHKMGDKFIKKAAEVFKAATRQEDIVARIGGDEFAIMLPEADSNTAQKICKRIQDKLKQYNKKKELPEPLEISLGYAVKIDQNQNLDEIFNKADQKMYQNKEVRKCSPRDD